jgi:hypothetical protein
LEWTKYDGQVYTKRNDVYLWNSCWFVFISMTTVGFGDVTPTTHAGRFMAVVSGFLGIVIVSLITASLANLLKFTSSEELGLNMIRRERARVLMEGAAAEIIRLWWLRHRRGAGRTLEAPRKERGGRRGVQDVEHIFKVKRAFQALHAQAHLEVDRQGTGPTLAKLDDVVTSIELHLAHLARNVLDDGPAKHPAPLTLGNAGAASPMGSPGTGSTAAARLVVLSPRMRESLQRLPGSPRDRAHSRSPPKRTRSRSHSPPGGTRAATKMSGSEQVRR